MGKVYRQDRKTVQRIKARDIVPGDIVEVAGRQICFLHLMRTDVALLLSFCQRFGGDGSCVACTCLGLWFLEGWPWLSHEFAENFNLDASVVCLKKYFVS